MCHVLGIFLAMHFGDQTCLDFELGLGGEFLLDTVQKNRHMHIVLFLHRLREG